MPACQSLVEIDTYICDHNYPIHIEIHQLIAVEYPRENTEEHFESLTLIKTKFPKKIEK
jgi:hypothetical protein